MIIDSDKQIVVTIRLLGFLNKWAGSIASEIEVAAGISIQQLLEQISTNCDDEFRSAIWDYQGRLHGGLEIMLNGQVITPRQIGEQKIMDPGELVLIPVIAGGSSRWNEYNFGK